MGFNILFFHVFCCCLPQEAREAEFTSTTHSHLLCSSAQPWNSYKIRIPHSNCTVSKWPFSSLLERFSKPSGIKSGTIRRWMGEYGEINQKSSNFPDFCQHYCIADSPPQALQSAVVVQEPSDGRNRSKSMATVPTKDCTWPPTWHKAYLTLSSHILKERFKRSGFENDKPKGLVDDRSARFETPAGIKLTTFTADCKFTSWTLEQFPSLESLIDP